MNYLKDENVHGVTFLGGEPMQQIKDNQLLDLITRIKRETTHDIWIYSGYTYEEILAHEKRFQILKMCDVLVDGLFVEELKDIQLRFRGSKNQRIIDIEASLQKGEVVLYSLEKRS